jgi:LPXTG-motif cell wall-anchored protein
MNNKNIAIIAGVGLTLGVGYFFLKRKKAQAVVAPPVVTPSIKIISPAEGENVYAGSTSTLMWEAHNITGNLHIEFHIEGEDDPFWVQQDNNPDVNDNKTEIYVPDKVGKNLAIHIGVWDWDNGRWVADDVVAPIHIVKSS